MEYRYNAIVIGKKDIGEMDRIYTLFTLEAGKVKVLGKSVKKAISKLAGNLEIPTRVEILAARTKGLGKIAGAVPIDFFPKIRKDIDALAETLRAIRILDEITVEQQKEEKVFSLLLEFLEISEKLSGQEINSDKIALIAAGFIFKLLDISGYRIEVEKCVLCQKKLQAGKNFFAAGLGGMVCPQCLLNQGEIFPVSDESIKLIRIFLKNNLSGLVKLKISSREKQGLKIITDYFLREIKK